MGVGKLGMTDEEILKLAETCGFDTFVGEKDDGTQSDYWECWEDQLLKFVRVMYNKGQEEEIRRQKTGIGYVNGVLFMDEF